MPPDDPPAMSVAPAAFRQGNGHTCVVAVKGSLSPEALGRGRQRMSLALDLTFLRLQDPSCCMTP